MGTIPEPQMRELLEAYVGEPQGLPPIDPAGQIAFIEEYFAAGAPEIGTVFRVCNLALRALCPLLKGKLFSRLDAEERADLINRVTASRNPLLRGVGVMLGLPALMSYYRRPEVAAPLGFDSSALKQEANLRVVARDRDLPPKEVGTG